MQTIKQVEDYLATLIPRSRSFGDRRAHVSRILEKLGNPQNAVPTIHIAGTSGKGSTAYYAAAILREAGYSVGLAVSPHISKVSERSQINGAPLPDDKYCRYISEFRGCIETLNETVTYIEFLTCFAFWLFAKLKVDYNVIEVGLGGRLDPTNTITRAGTVRVITDIGFDHTEILGDTLDAIAAEKAGIIHDGDVVCIHPQGALVMKSINTAVGIHNARLVLVDTPEYGEGAPSGYQYRNWTLAKQAVYERMSLDTRPLPTKEQLVKASQYTIPGRFEVFTDTQGTIILDAAHNPQKMTAFTQTLRERYPTQPIIAVVSFGKNKQSTAEETLEIITGNVEAVIVTEFSLDADESHGAMDARKLSQLSLRSSIRTQPLLIEALAEAKEWSRRQNGLVVVTGSVYLVSNIRSLISH